jgi:DNA-binding MarR family transcriptional regulator
MRAAGLATRERRRPVGGQARTLIGHLDATVRRLAPAARKGLPEPPVNRQDVGVVDTLGAMGSCTMGQLAARVRLPLSTATRIVDRLEAQRIVERRRDERNRRIVLVDLGPEGQRFYRSALAERISAARRMLQCLTDAERAELLRLFAKIAGALESADGGDCGTARTAPEARGRRSR